MQHEILNLLLVLFIAWVGGIMAKRIGYPAILGELVIGIIFGPAVIGLLHPSELVSALSEIGIVLLMAYIGMEIDLKDLRKASWIALFTAVGSFIVPFFLGYWAIISFGGTKEAALLVGLAISVTSLATKSRILLDLKLLNTRIASILMVGALFTDTIALVCFAGIASFSDVGSVNSYDLLIVTIKVILFFIVAFVFGKYLLPILGRILEKLGFVDRTFYFTLIIIITLLFAEFAELAGLHAILGAFIAGLFVRDETFNRKLTHEVNNVFYDVSIGFLAPVYFVSVGFDVSLNVFSTNIVLLVVIISLAIVGKILGTALFYLPSGNGWREGLTIGTGMNGRGVVEIIIAGIGLKMGIINKEIFSILVFMAIFTTLTVPFLLTWTSNWLRRRNELVYIEKRTGLLILGVNPLSLLIAGKMKKDNQITMVDTNIDMVNLAQKEGFNCIQGNILNEDVMALAEAANVKTFIALTRNTEINILASQMASNVFKIPEKYVLFSPGEDGASINLLDNIGASTLFAQKTLLTDWTVHISDGKYELQTIEIQQKIKSSKWIKMHVKNEIDKLAIFIKSKNGEIRLFHYDSELSVGEEVIYLVKR